MNKLNVSFLLILFYLKLKSYYLDNYYFLLFLFLNLIIKKVFKKFVRNKKQKTVKIFKTLIIKKFESIVSFKIAYKSFIILISM